MTTYNPLASKNHMIIFHGNCWDGFGAAMVVRQFILECCQPDPKIELVAGWYGMPTPEVDGLDVWIVDFSFPPEQFSEIIDRARDVCWLDHHKTAVEACEAIAFERGVKGLRDMDRSGVRLAWDFLNGTPEPWTPWEVRYIEDRDLWRFAQPNSEEVGIWIRSHEMTVETWEKFQNTDVLNVMAEGRAMLAYHRRLVANAAANATWFTIGGVTMPMVTASYDLGSDVCDFILREKDVPIAGYMLINRQGDWQYGFRSKPGFDCSEIAKRLGGGGHAQAAGCKSPEPLHEVLF